MYINTDQYGLQQYNYHFTLRAKKYNPWNQGHYGYFQETCVIFSICLGFSSIFPFKLHSETTILPLGAHKKRRNSEGVFVFSHIRAQWNYANASRKDKNEGLELGALMYFQPWFCFGYCWVQGYISNLVFYYYFFSETLQVCCTNTPTVFHMHVPFKWRVRRHLIFLDHFNMLMSKIIF